MPNGKLIALATVLLVAAVLGACDTGRAGPAAPAAKARPGAASADKPAALFLSPNGNDSGPCSRSQPCQTFDHAYHQAKPGDTVEVAAGTYPDQLISGRGQTAPGVLFRPAAGAQVTVGEVRTDPTGISYFEIRNMTLADAYLAAGTHDVVLRNDQMKLFYLRSTTNVSIIGGGVGPDLLSPNSPTIGAADTTPSRNTLIDGVTFHDIRIDPSVVPAEHGECLFVQESDGLVIRNSRFQNCSHFDIYFHQISGGGNPRNVTLENNFFAQAQDGGFYALFFRNDTGEDITNVTIRHNSAAQGIHFDTDGTISNVTVEANVYGPTTQGQCVSQVKYAYNVIDGGRCAPTDARAQGGFVNAATNDLHLTRGARALDFVPPTIRGSQLDIDGQVRPARARSDAGASQRETARIVLGRSIGATKLGASAEDLTAFYGAPRRTAHRGKVTTMTFRAHGGTISATVAADRVVGISTTSPYYTTATGVGPGSPMGPLRAGASWTACRNAFRRPGGGSATLFLTPAGGKNSARIGAVAIVSREFSNC